MPDGPAKQRHVEYTAVRTDTGDPMRGIVFIDIFNNPAQGVYAYASWVRTTPAADHDKWDPVLAQMQKLLFYHPQSPATPESARGQPHRLALAAGAEGRDHPVGAAGAAGAS